jgi:hypothetical protein
MQPMSRFRHWLQGSNATFALRFIRDAKHAPGFLLQISIGDPDCLVGKVVRRGMQSRASPQGIGGWTHHDRCRLHCRTVQPKRVGTGATLPIGNYTYRESGCSAPSSHVIVHASVNEGYAGFECCLAAEFAAC